MKIGFIIIIMLNINELEKTSLNGNSFWYEPKRKLIKKSIKKLDSKSIGEVTWKVLSKINVVAIIIFSFFITSFL